MKKLLSIVVLLMFSIIGHAQQSVTQFLGIPVDGSKSEMIKKLRDKGYKYDATDDYLTGEFNGRDVKIRVVTNNNKVCRVVVFDAIPVDERAIQVRFNRLCEQFVNNPRYTFPENQTIPDNEDISYEMIVNKKRYEAVFYQNPEETGLLQRPVWFVINDFYGKYYIAMYYDNEFNRANGSDL